MATIFPMVGGTWYERIMLDDRVLLSLIDAIYDATLDPQRWGDALRAVRCAFGGAAAGYHRRRMGPNSGAAQMWVGLDSSFEDAYLRHYYRQDPWFPKTERMAPGECALSVEVVGVEALRRTAIYNELFQPYGYHDLVGGLVCRTPQEVVTFSVLGGLGPISFDTRHREFLQRLMPHLHRAFALSRRLDLTARERADLAAIFDSLQVGVVLLDEQGTIIRTNHAADRILDREAELTRTSQGLLTASTSLTRKLRDALARAAICRPGEHGAGLVPIRVPRATARSPLIILIAPVRPDRHTFGESRARAVAYLVDPEMDAETSPILLQRLFGLTPAEARIALCVGRGKVPKEAAAELGISWNTARAQLRQVFAKTGTDRQSSLASLLSKIGLVTESAVHGPST